MKIYEYIKQKKLKKQVLFFVSKLGILDRGSYKNHLKHFNKVKFTHDYENVVLFPTYQNYLNIFNRDLTIKESWEKDIYLKTEIKLIEALKGNNFKVFYWQIVKCTDCVRKPTDDKCCFCNSSGMVQKEGLMSICYSCKGYGYHKKEKCETCNNTLYYKKYNSVTITTDKNFYEGLTYTFANSGNYDISSNKYGYLKIKPTLTSDTTQSNIELKIVNGSSLESEETIPIFKMALGGSYDISHASGKCTVMIEPSSQPGDYKVINNIGIPHYYDEDENEIHKGSQVVYLNLKLPGKEELQSNLKLQQLLHQLKTFDDQEELDKLNNLF